DEALHQLVGDVIVLGQQLAGDVECDAVGSVAGDRVLEAPRNVADRPVPARASAVALGMEQPALEPDRVAAVRALRAEPAAVRGVRRVAGDFDLAFAGDGRRDSAADAAVGAGGADHIPLPSAGGARGGSMGRTGPPPTPPAGGRGNITPP